MIRLTVANFIFRVGCIGSLEVRPPQTLEIGPAGIGIHLITAAMFSPSHTSGFASLVLNVISVAVFNV